MSNNVMFLLILLGLAAAAVVCTLIFVVAVDRSVAREKTEDRRERGEDEERVGEEPSQDKAPN